MKKEYEMTTEEYKELMSSCRPVPMIAINCGTPPSQQENANAAWKRLGNKLGFDYMTVEPSTKGRRFFIATESVRDVCPEIEMANDMVNSFVETAKTNLRQDKAPPKRSVHDPMNWAEGLIEQLPESHEGRWSWLACYGLNDIANELRRKDRRDHVWDEEAGRFFV